MPFQPMYKFSCVKSKIGITWKENCEINIFLKKVKVMSIKFDSNKKERIAKSEK